MTAPEQSLPTTAERLRGFARTARRRWPLLLAITLVAGASAGLVAQSQPKEYEATAKLLLSDSDVTGLSGDATSSSSRQDPERDINTKLKLIRIETVAGRVARQLDGLSTRRLIDAVEVSPEGTSNLVDITATDASATRAAAIANAFATEYVTFRVAVARAALLRAADNVRSELAAVPSRARGSAEAAALRANLRRLQVSSAVQTGGAQVVLDAKAPAAASRPKPTRAAVLGGVVGLIFAIGLVALLELRDWRLRDADTAVKETGLPLLATIRRAPRIALRRREDPTVQSAYDELASRVLASVRGAGVRRLVVSSPGTGDGKTTVTSLLARALAKLGQRVIVVQTDVYSATIATNHDSAIGLVDVIGGRVELQDALVDVDVETMRPKTSATTLIGEGGISVLPLGDIRRSVTQPRPWAGKEWASLVPQSVAHPGISELLNECSLLANLVLVDAPPVSRLASATGLIERVDAGLVICRLDWTATEALSEAMATLTAIGLPVIGLVVTGAHTSRRHVAAPSAHGATSTMTVFRLPVREVPARLSEKHTNGHER